MFTTGYFPAAYFGKSMFGPNMQSEDITAAPIVPVYEGGLVTIEDSADTALITCNNNEVQLSTVA